MELIKQVPVNVDYILMLVEEHRKECGDGEDVELTPTIYRAINANPNLPNMKDLVEEFVAIMSVDEAVDSQWGRFITTKRNQELDEIIRDEDLRPEETRNFMGNAFRDGEVQTTGTGIIEVMRPMSQFGGAGRSGGNPHAEKKNRVIKALGELLSGSVGWGLVRSWRTEDPPPRAATLMVPGVSSSNRSSRYRLRPRGTGLQCDD
ncbi:type I restriction endonuclease subunit R, EcoR124 family [Cutibacterium sp. V947]|uniref:type I restriction endonuclease subunit R, EcoR124 family n=1 Tax=Cutibacterium sp. V947 TaxID=3446480 RepID=UPI003EE2584A